MQDGTLLIILSSQQMKEVDQSQKNGEKPRKFKQNDILSDGTKVIQMVVKSMGLEIMKNRENVYIGKVNIRFNCTWNQEGRSIWRLEFHGMYSILNIRRLKSRMRWVGHEEHVGDDTHNFGCKT